MANSTNSANPVILDTATAVSIAGTFRAFAVVYTSCTAADTALLQDSGGNTIWSATGPARDILSGEHTIIFNGIVCNTLTAGRVFIYAKLTH